MTQVIGNKILKEFIGWLKLPSNNTNGRIYHNYDYCLNRLFEKAIELQYITQQDVDEKIFEAIWLKDILDIYKNSSDLKTFDEDKNEGGKGRASLTHFIKFVKQKSDRIGGESFTDEEEQRDNMTGHQNNAVDKYDLNLILYGPPGTGKTYNTVNYAVAIIEGKDIEEIRNENHDDVLKRYKEYVKCDRIAFTTFHQSYGYEEFIEGIKPVTDKGTVKYDVLSGVFKEFCERAKKQLNPGDNRLGAPDGIDLIKSTAIVWKISLDSAGRKKLEYHDKCLNDNCIRVGWDSDEDLSLVNDTSKDSARRFIEEMKIGDIVLSCYSAKEIDAIGVIVGEYEWHDDEPRLKRFRKVKWLKKWTGKTKYNILADNDGVGLTQTTVYELWRITVDKIKQILAAEQSSEEADRNAAAEEELVESTEATADGEPRYVFIIDEINRGNVSKIFGELITLIESSKRLGADEEMKCTLPYSKDKFGVPKNVYILGTMNTADRSLVQLDTALRRRFGFEEMMPRPDLLKTTADGIDLNKLLTEINTRIAALLDREHQIGHSYFIKTDNNLTISEVVGIFKKHIIPLLQEYFFDDYESIKSILGKNFIKEVTNPFSDGKKIYSVTVSENKDDYISIYGGATIPAENE